MPAQEFSPPEQFDEFRLVRKLGEGAMGQVFLCTDQTLHRPVAVKFLKVASTSEKERERCLNEARAIARLTHANVVTIYRVGETRGVPYIASEFIEGQSLDQVPLPLPYDRVLPIAVSLARGLAVAHERGVLHRDVKPANIMITRSSEVKLLDFGVAKLLEDYPTTTTSSFALAPVVGRANAQDREPALGQSDEGDSAVARSLGAAGTNPAPAAAPAAGLRRPAEKRQPVRTLASSSPLTPNGPASDGATDASISDSMVGLADTNPAPSADGGAVQRSYRAMSNFRVGTPLYMSPETWRGEAIGPRADIYSLGAVLYELCTGVPPHDALDIETLHIAATTEDVAPLLSAAPRVPPRFAEIVDRCLKRDQNARFASGTELLSALEALQRASDVAITPVAGSLPSSPRRIRAIALIASGGAALAGGLFFYLTRPVSGMVTYQGATFTMGATTDEIAAAQHWCKELLGSECDEVVQQAFKREEPQRQVTLSPFRLDRREVTTEEFVGWLNAQSDLKIEGDRYVKQNGVLLADIYPTYQPFAGYAYDKQQRRFFVPSEFRRRPATQLSWLAASRYCVAQGKRLPTEAEWELAARGSEGRRFPWGYSEPSCEGSVVARLPGMSCAKEGIGPRDVASTASDRTPEGLYDLGGNVSEWVLDDFRERYPDCAAPCKDPLVAPQQDAARAVRGGNWEWPAFAARGTTRSRYAPNLTPKNFGFRCAEPLSDSSTTIKTQ